MQDRKVRAERGGDRLVAAAGGQDGGSQIQHVAGHPTDLGGPGGGVVQEAVQRARRLVGLQQARGQFLFLPGRAVGGARGGEAGEGLSEGVQPVQSGRQVTT
ncbi:hypothetical protein ACIRBZ_46920 [Streptomyces sp. NPDC094038]|uniref:hypothetical protein n=1 Tax=Streptomyces sp. NPDC094038 TaxID=3366055 RepID=UPI003801C642